LAGRIFPSPVAKAPTSASSCGTPLFSRAVAVVVDSGGVASHAAIVAREYGLPAVMGTGTATTALVTGQMVTVDGNTGRVTMAGEGGGRPRG
jgi:phosphohistidine swiveling domain-containing protein